MGRGGLETMIMNYYRNIDRTKIQFDFLVHRQEKADYDDEILSLTSVVCNKTIRRLCSSIEIFIDKEMEQRATPKIYLDGKTKVLDFKDIKIELDGEIQLAFNNVRDLNLKRLNS